MMEDKKIRVRVIRSASETSAAVYGAAPPFRGVAEETERAAEASGVAPLLPFRDHSLSRWRKISKTCLVLAVFLVPLWFLPISESPVEVNKIVATAFLILIAFGAYIADVVETRSLQYPHSLVALSFALVGVAALLGAFFSLHPAASVYGFLQGADSLLVIGIVLVAGFLASVLFGARDVPSLFRAMFMSITLAGIVGIAQFFGVYLFPFDAARSPNFTTVGSLFGWGALMGFGLLMALLFKKEDHVRPRRIFFYGGVFVMGVGLLLLNYSYIWLTLGIASFVLSGIRFVEGKSVKMPIAGFMISFVLFFGGASLPALTKIGVEIRPGLQTSFSVAKAAIRGVRAFVGTGPGTFGIDYSRFRPAATTQSDFWNVRFPDGYNAFAGVFATGGLAGFFALFMLAAAFFIFLIRRGGTEHEHIALPALLLIANWFFFPAFFTGLFLVSVGIGVLLSSEGMVRSVDFSAVSRKTSFAVFGVAMAMALFLIWVAYGIGERYAGAIAYGSGARAFRARDFSLAVARMARASAIDPDAEQYLIGLSQAHLLRANDLFPQGGLSNAEVQSAVAGAVLAARQAIEASPNDPLVWNNAGVVYENMLLIASRSDEFAIQSYAKASELEPQNPDYFVAMGRVALTKIGRTGGDASAEHDEATFAEQMFNRAIALKPEYALPHFLLAQLYIKTGDFTRAAAKMEEIKTARPEDAGIGFQLGLLYYQNDKFDEAQKEFERTIVLSPNYSNARYFLGLIYDRKGMQRDALAQFTKILEFNPGNAEVERIIANLEAGNPALEQIAPPGVPPEQRSDVPVPETSPSQKSKEP